MNSLLLVLGLLAAPQPAEAKLTPYAHQPVVIIAASSGTCTTFSVTSHTVTEVVLSTVQEYKSLFVQNYESSANVFGSWNSVEVSTLTTARKGMVWPGSTTLGSSNGWVPIPRESSFYLQCDANNAKCSVNVCRTK